MPLRREESGTLRREGDVRGEFGPRVFNPQNLPGYVIDLWAEDGPVIIGGRYSEWPNLPDGINYLQAAAGNRPTEVAFGNSVSGDFAGSQGLEVAVGPSDPSTTYTFHIIGAIDLTSAQRALLDFALGRIGLYAANAGFASFNDGAFQNSGSAATGDQFLTMRYKPGVGLAEVWRGGVSIGTATVAAKSIGGASAIGVATGFSHGFNGRIHRMLGFNLEQTTDVHDEIRAFTNARLGMAL